MANVIYERTNPNVSSTFGNIAAALDSTLTRQHGYFDNITNNIGNMLKLGGNYMDERSRAKDLDGSNHLIEELQKKLTELKREEALLLSQIRSYETSPIPEEGIQMDDEVRYAYSTNDNSASTLV